MIIQNYRISIIIKECKNLSIRWTCNERLSNAAASKTLTHNASNFNEMNAIEEHEQKKHDNAEQQQKKYRESAK